MATKSAPSRSNANPQNSVGSIRSTASSLAHSQPVQDIVESAREYARAHPEAAALWAFGIGFVLAWKIKPW